MKSLKKLNLKSLITNYQLLITVVIAIGAFLRFHGLNWGLPYPFHPDERNMAVAITRFSSKNLNPEFFAYGQFPLYLAYFSAQILSFWLPLKIKETLSFDQAVLFLRFWSAIFSTATIYVGYLIAKKLFSSKKTITYHLSPITPLLIAFTPGLIQAAHFGTTESILAFSFLAITYFSLNILEKPSFKNFFWTAFSLGIALGSKISAAVFCVPLILATLRQLKKLKPFKEKLKLILMFIFTLSLSLALTVLTSPYLLLAKKDSIGTLLYEVSVAEGKSLTFYTRQFTSTTPVLFQFQKIFPYALGWPIFILGAFGILVSLFSIIRKISLKKRLTFSDFALCTLHFALFAYFIPNAFLFAKWTRFMTPIFPFFSIFAGYFLKYFFDFLKKSHFRLISPFRRNSPKGTYLYILISFFAIIPGLIFSQVYFKPDIRFAASEWIFNNIPPGSQILFDTANVIDIPILPPKSPLLQKFPHYNLKLISFNFYDLDQSLQLFDHLINYLETSDYIFVPSRRVFMNHLRFPEKYPLVAKYYQLLFSGKLGFNKTAEFKIFNDEPAEESWSVFDHPRIQIFKKTAYHPKNYYEDLFKRGENL